MMTILFPINIHNFQKIQWENTGHNYFDISVSEFLIFLKHKFAIELNLQATQWKKVPKIEKMDFFSNATFLMNFRESL